MGAPGVPVDAVADRGGGGVALAPERRGRPGNHWAGRLGQACHAEFDRRRVSDESDHQSAHAPPPTQQVDRDAPQIDLDGILVKTGTGGKIKNVEHRTDSVMLVILLLHTVDIPTGSYMGLTEHMRQFEVHTSTRT